LTIKGIKSLAKTIDDEPTIDDFKVDYLEVLGRLIFFD